MLVVLYETIRIGGEYLKYLFIIANFTNFSVLLSYSGKNFRYDTKFCNRSQLNRNVRISFCVRLQDKERK